MIYDDISRLAVTKIKWYQTLTAAYGPGCKFLSKMTSETNKPLHAYFLLIFFVKDRTYANQVRFLDFSDAFGIWFFVRRMFFYGIHALLKNMYFENIRAPLSKRCKHSNSQCKDQKSNECFSNHSALLGFLLLVQCTTKIECLKICMDVNLTLHLHILI